MPVALLQNDTDHQLIDATGAVIMEPTRVISPILKLSPVTMRRQILFFGAKTEPELFSEVWAISFRSERRWDVYLKNGMEIRLPESDPISA